MADQEPHSLASTFPNPPPFWRDFTPERVARIEELRSNRAEDRPEDAAAIAAGTARIPDLPEDLVNLQPPREPVDGRWRVFGDQYMLDDKLPTLEDQGITNLPTTAPSNAKDAKHYDRALELKRLAKSLLLNFLEMAGTLSRNPAHTEAKMQDLRTLFINMHHILNEYRPHQARESAIELMQDHRDRTRAETAAIRTQVDKARRVLEGLGSLSVAGGGGGGGATAAITTAATTSATTASALAASTTSDLTGQDGDKREDAVDVQREAEVWALTDAMFV